MRGPSSASGVATSQFSDQYLRPLLAEAHKLGLSPAEVKDMIDEWEPSR